MDADSLTVCIKTEIYIRKAKDVWRKSDTGNYELNRPLPIGKIKVIGLLKYEQGRKIMKICFFETENG